MVGTNYLWNNCLATGQVISYIYFYWSVVIISQAVELQGARHSLLCILPLQLLVKIHYLGAL